MPYVCAGHGQQQDLEEQRRALWGDLDQLYPKGLEDPLLRMVELEEEEVNEEEEAPLSSDVNLFPGQAEDVVDEQKDDDVDEEGLEEGDHCYGCSTFRIASLVDLRVTWTPLGCCPREVEVLQGSSSFHPMIIFVVETWNFMDVAVLLELNKKLSENKPGLCSSMYAIVFASRRQQILLVDLACISESESDAISLRELLESGKVEEAVKDHDLMISNSLQIGKEKLDKHPGKLIVIRSTKKGFPTEAVNVLSSITVHHTIDIIQISTSGHAHMDTGIEALVEDSGGITAVVENSKELFGVLKYRTGVCGGLAFSLHVQLMLPASLGLQEVRGPGVRDTVKTGCHVEFNVLSVTGLDEYELCLQPRKLGNPPDGLGFEAPLQCVVTYVTVWGETVRQQTCWRLIDDDIFVHGRLSWASQLSEQRRAARRGGEVTGSKSSTVQRLLHVCHIFKTMLLWCGCYVQRAVRASVGYLLDFTRHCTTMWSGTAEVSTVMGFPMGQESSVS